MAIKPCRHVNRPIADVLTDSVEDCIRLYAGHEKHTNELYPASLPPGGALGIVVESSNSGDPVLARGIACCIHDQELCAVSNGGRRCIAKLLLAEVSSSPVSSGLLPGIPDPF